MLEYKSSHNKSNWTLQTKKFCLSCYQIFAAERMLLYQMEGHFPTAITFEAFNKLVILQ